MSQIENKSPRNTSPIPTTIAPWLSVDDSAKAIDFYKLAFGAIETYRLDDPDAGPVARMSIDGAEFWLSGESPENGNFSPELFKKGTVRMILTVTDPDALFVRALEAGASQIFPVGEGYGWRVGRLADPFGHHWEIGRPL